MTLSSRNEQNECVSYIISFFEKNPITLQHKPTINKVRFILDDISYEYNFRVIDSILPEILYTVALKSYCQSISKAISRVNNSDLPYNVVAPSLYLVAKFCHLFEVVLFSNFSKEVWKGNWINNSYRFNTSSYTLYNWRRIIPTLLERIGICYNPIDSAITFIWVL